MLLRLICHSSIHTFLIVVMIYQNTTKSWCEKLFKSNFKFKFFYLLFFIFYCNNFTCNCDSVVMRNFSESQSVFMRYRKISGIRNLSSNIHLFHPLWRNVEKQFFFCVSLSTWLYCHTFIAVSHSVMWKIQKWYTNSMRTLKNNFLIKCTFTLLYTAV